MSASITRSAAVALSISIFAGSSISSANAFVAPRPSAADSAYRVIAFATLEDTSKATESSLISTSPLESADAAALETAEMTENPRKSGLALMLDGGELYYFPYTNDEDKSNFYHKQCSLYTDAQQIVELPAETLY